MDEESVPSENGARRQSSVMNGRAWVKLRFYVIQEASYAPYPSAKPELSLSDRTCEVCQESKAVEVKGEEILLYWRETPSIQGSHLCGDTSGRRPCIKQGSVKILFMLVNRAFLLT